MAGSAHTPGSPGPGFVILLALALLAAPLLAGCTSPEVPGDADGQEVQSTSDGGDGGPADEGDEPPATEGAGNTSGDQTAANDTLQPRRNDTVWVGAWLGAWPNSENRALAQFNQQAGQRLDVVNVLLSWNTSFSSLRPTLDHIASAGARPLLTWSPDGLTTTQVADGSTEIHLDTNETVTVDGYIDSFAQGICSYAQHTGTQVLLEPMAEPNGDWHTWSIGYTTQAGEPSGNTSGNQAGGNASEGSTSSREASVRPNTNASYQDAWTHLHERFTATCSDGASFIWTVNGVSSGAGTSYMGAYPGNQTVDKAGIRGMNLGAHQPQGWSSFGGTFGHAYCNLTAATDHDIVLTSVGSVEEGGDKAHWVNQTFLNASSHAWPEVKGLVWFDDQLTLGDQQLDVTIDSSTEALAAFQQGMDRLENGEIPEGKPMPCPEDG